MANTMRVIGIPPVRLFRQWRENAPAAFAYLESEHLILAYFSENVNIEAREIIC